MAAEWSQAFAELEIWVFLHMPRALKRSHRSLDDSIHGLSVQVRRLERELLRLKARAITPAELSGLFHPPHPSPESELEGRLADLLKQAFAAARDPEAAGEPSLDHEPVNNFAASVYLAVAEAMALAFGVRRHFPTKRESGKAFLVNVTASRPTDDPEKDGVVFDVESPALLRDLPGGRTVMVRPADAKVFIYQPSHDQENAG